MAAFLVASAETLILSACSRDVHQPLNTVRGTVTFQKQPAVKAIVVFRPVSPIDAKVPLPHAEVEADGTFRLGTYGVDDGAPEGEYLVTVTWPEKRIEPGTGDETTEDRLKGRFANPGKTPLKATVRAGENQLEPFRLD